MFSLRSFLCLTLLLAASAVAFAAVVPIHERANVLPMVPPGAANRHMIAEPELEPAHA